MTIIELLDEWNIPHVGPEHEHVREGWAGVDCPLCDQGMGRFHLGIHLESGACSCWRCGTFQLFAVLMLLGIPKATLTQFFRGFQPRHRAPRERPRGKLVRPPGVGDFESVHERYINSRGFDPSYLAYTWGVRGIGFRGGRFRWRLYIPIHHDGREVSWTTRSIRRNGGYVSAKPDEESVPHKSLLYGADFCVHSIVIVEGPADAWRIGPGAAAIMGLQWTTAQLNTMVRFPNRYVCFDNEPAAQRRSNELCGILSAFPGETKSVTLKGPDPADSPWPDVERLRQMLELGG
ncbi:MAG: toprim domain-containing protein [Planctomycetota bacterium]